MAHGKAITKVIQLKLEPNHMPFSTIPLNDGNKLPEIAFGTGSVNKRKDVTDQVEQAFEAGFWHIDTAQTYANEESVGKAIRECGLKREELFITTKYIGRLGTSREALESSLQKIGLKYIDLYLIHDPIVVNRPIELVWKEFEDLQVAGLARYNPPKESAATVLLDGLSRSIGVSNFNVEQLQRLLNMAKVVPAVNQIEFHPYVYTTAKPILEFCRSHGIAVEGYSPLSSITKYPGGPVDKPVQEAANRLRISATQVLLLWVKSKGAAIVTTSSQKERLLEYLAVGDLGPLTEEEIVKIEAAASKGPTASFFLREHWQVPPNVHILALLLVTLCLVFLTNSLSLGIPGY